MVKININKHEKVLRTLLQNTKYEVKAKTSKQKEILKKVNANDAYISNSAGRKKVHT